MRLSELIFAIKQKKPIIFHTPDDLLQINAKYDSNIVSGYEIIIRITNKCNINCEFCFVDSIRKDYCEISLNKLMAALCCINLSGTKVVISVGEPTIHPGFYDYINKLSKSNAFVVIQTNAILFSNKSNVHRLPKKDVNFFVSFPSPNEKKYEQITNSKFFSQAINGMKNISEHYKMTINFVVYKDNYQDIFDLISVIKENFNQKNIVLLISNLGMTDKFESFDKLERYGKIIYSFKSVFKQKYDFKIRFTISGGCSFPLCIINEIYNLEYKNLFKADEKTISFDKLNKPFYKKNVCRDCRYGFYCQGFLRDYIKKFGDDEINPIL